MFASLAQSLEGATFDGEIPEEVTEVEEVEAEVDVEATDDALDTMGDETDEIEKAEAITAILKAHGLHPSLLAALQLNNSLPAMVASRMPSLESLAGTVAPQKVTDEAVAAMEAMIAASIENLTEKVKELATKLADKVSNFFKSVWGKISSFFKKTEKAEVTNPAAEVKNGITSSDAKGLLTTLAKFTTLIGGAFLTTKLIRKGVLKAAEKYSGPQLAAEIASHLPSNMRVLAQIVAIGGSIVLVRGAFDKLFFTKETQTVEEAGWSGSQMKSISGEAESAGKAFIAAAMKAVKFVVESFQRGVDMAWDERARWLKATWRLITIPFKAIFWVLRKGMGAVLGSSGVKTAEA